MANQAYTETWLAGPSQTQFYTRTYLPPDGSKPKAVIVFIHGFAEHVGRYTHFHPLFAQRGIAVFAIDQRGHGLTAQDEKKRSKASRYGKTSWKDQMRDIEWAIGHVRETIEGVPLFLMGHSMGGAEVLGFPMQGDKSATLSSISGVISTSPLIKQTESPPKILGWIGTKASALLPYALIPATVKAEDLSHDKAVNDAYLNDPLIHQSGSLKGISDMLNEGEALLTTHYKNWPSSLPLLIVHGTADKVTSHKASQAFHDKISASTKKIVLFEGGFHELQNEPDGVKEKLLEEVITFIESNLTSSHGVVPGIVVSTASNEILEATATAEGHAKL